MLTDFQCREIHTRDHLIQYLDIACLARRFRRPKLEIWAQNTLRPILIGSKRSLAVAKWEKDTLLCLRPYDYSNRLVRLVSPAATFVQYFISVSAANSKTVTGDETSSFNLDTCVELFTDPGLLKDNPALFGCVFVSILSLGHRSSTWNTKLAGRDKAIHYAAQVQPNEVSSQLSSLACLLQPLAGGTLSTICESCQQRFKVYGRTFGQYRSLNSSSGRRIVACSASTIPSILSR